MHAQPPVHSQSLVNGQSSIFTCELRKYSQNLKTFTGWVPSDNWTLGLQHTWNSSFGTQFRNFLNWRRRKPRHSVQNALLVSLNITISCTYGKAIFRNIYWLNSSKSTEIFALREFETLQLSEVFGMLEGCRIVCRKLRYADLSSLIIYDIPLIKGVSETLL